MKNGVIGSSLNGMEKWLVKERPTENEDFENSHQGKLLQIFSDFASFEVPLVELPRVEESDPRSIGRECAIFGIFTEFSG